MQPSPSGVLDTKAAANFVGLSPSTLTKLRITGYGPRYSKLGRRVVYSTSDLISWLYDNKRSSTSDTGIQSDESSGYRSASEVAR